MAKKKKIESAEQAVDEAAASEQENEAVGEAVDSSQSEPAQSEPAPEEPTPAVAAPAAVAPATTGWDANGSEANAAGPALLPDEPTPPLGRTAAQIAEAAKSLPQRYCAVLGGPVTVHANGRCVVCNVSWAQHPAMPSQAAAQQ